VFSWILGTNLSFLTYFVMCMSRNMDMVKAKASQENINIRVHLEDLGTNGKRY
jgi:hypothetical protein